MKMYNEDDLLPISALQHLLFCERQCALIHVERIWTENMLTVEGRNMHEGVDRTHEIHGKDWSQVFSLDIRSLRYGLAGRADCVEVSSVNTGLRILPVEYKHGSPKKNDMDRVQLCAQALCLEEMTGFDISQGALYYGTTRRRELVILGSELRCMTQRTIQRLHEIASRSTIPVWKKSAKCRSCSLLEYCMPDTLNAGHRVEGYLQGLYTAVEDT